MPLSAQELADLRQDIGDTGSPPAFSDAQLQRNYERAEGDYNRTVVTTLRQLLASSARLHAYSMGQSSESLDQVYQHVQDLLALWQRIAGEQSGEITSGSMELGLDETLSAATEWA